MLQRLAGIPDDDPEGDSIRANLARNREDLGRAERDLEELKARLEDIPRLEDSQRRFSETDLPARLKESRVLQSEEARFETAATHVATETARLQPALVTGTGDTPDEVSKTEADSSARGKALGGLDAAMRTLNMRLGEAAGIIQGALDGARHEVEILRAAWRQATQPLRDGTAEVLRTLAEEGHDPNQYLQAAKKLDDLTDEAKKQGLREGTVKSLSSDRASLLRQLADHSNHRLETLHEAIRTANNATQGVVVVKPATSPQRTHVFSLIESCVAGQRTKIKAAVEAPDFSPQEFAQTCRLGVGELEDKYQINGTQAQRLVEAGETLFRQIEEQVIDYAVDVELDIGSGSGTRQYRKLDDLSKGQKATALLLLLLGAAQGTLIIDQPEDDLDNRFIYEGVVKRLRQLKGVRQVIVATHNANVPVLGDAELLVVLDGDGEHGYPVQDGVGSLDDPSIRRLVEDVLEGGQAAFTARQHLYGF
jgi:hypothetical protein